MLHGLAPGIAMLRAPNPGPMTGTGTNTYLLGSEELVVVDPGPRDDAFLEQILAVAQTRQATIAAVWLTHAHPDHAGNVGALCQATGAPLVAWHAPNRVYWVADLPPPQTVAKDGMVLTVGGESYQVVHTPGHASDHLCFYRVSDGILLSGDLINDGNTVVIARPDGDLGQYLDSLCLVRGLPLSQILPGHGEPIRDAHAALDTYLRHRAMREGQVLQALGDAACRVADLRSRLYPDLAIALHPVAEQQLDAHLHKLIDEGRVTHDDDTHLYRLTHG